MSDVDRTITTLQNLINGARNKGLKTTTVFISTLSKCMALLKEKRPVTPKDYPGEGQFYCGHCEFPIGVSGVNYCARCGTPVDWKSLVETID